MPEKIAATLVTGASSGIGAEYCRQLAGRSDVIIAAARRRDRLEALREELSGRTELIPLVADLQCTKGRTRVIECMREHGGVDYLVNNAGFGALGKFADVDLESQQAMVDIHVSATLALTHAALQFMIDKGEGYIVNMSSTGAFAGNAVGMVYGGSKAFLNIFSEGLQAEVAADGVKVQCICPGHTHSEFHDQQTVTRIGVTRDHFPKEMWMDAEAVVSISLEALDSDSDRVIVVPGEYNQALVRSNVQAHLDKLGPD